MPHNLLSALEKDCIVPQNKVSNIMYSVYSAPTEYPCYRKVIRDFPNSLIAMFVYHIIFSPDLDGERERVFSYGDYQTKVSDATIDLFIAKLRDKKPDEYFRLTKWIETTRKIVSNHSNLFIEESFNPRAGSHDEIYRTYRAYGSFPFSHDGEKNKVYISFCSLLNEVIHSSDEKETWMRIIEDSYMEE